MAEAKGFLQHKLRPRLYLPKAPRLWWNLSNLRGSQAYSVARSPLQPMRGMVDCREMGKSILRCGRRSGWS